MKILSIEDSKESQVFIEHALQDRFELEFVESYNDAQDKLSHDQYDCIIVDLNLPDNSGLNILNKINYQIDDNKTAVILLTSETSDAYIAEALNMGVDDYIVKPVNSLELVARIVNRVNRKQLSHQDSFYVVWPFEIHLITSRIFAVDTNPKTELIITPIEFKILHILIRQPGQVFTRKMIINKLWGDDYYLEPRSIDKHISSLRNKIGRYSSFIKTIPGEGYSFEAEERKRPV